MLYGSPTNVDFGYIWSQNYTVFAFGARLSASATQFSQVQLWLPATATKSVSISAIDVVVSASDVNLKFVTVALATLVGAGFSTHNGGQSALAQIRTAQPVGANAATAFVSWLPAANQTTRVSYPYVIQLDPGNGLLLETEAINTVLWAYFTWGEAN